MHDRSLWPPADTLRDTALLWVTLLPLFAAIVLAQVVAPNEWSVVALIAIAAPLVALTRAGLVLHRRRTA
jgi:hypothetical protein